MPPRTRMTPDEVAASVKSRQEDWEKRTGLKLLTKEPKEIFSQAAKRLKRKREDVPDEG